MRNLEQAYMKSKLKASPILMDSLSHPDKFVERIFSQFDLSLAVGASKYICVPGY